MPHMKTLALVFLLILSQIMLSSCSDDRDLQGRESPDESEPVPDGVAISEAVGESENPAAAVDDDDLTQAPDGVAIEDAIGEAEIESAAVTGDIQPPVESCFVGPEAFTVQFTNMVKQDGSKGNTRCQAEFTIENLSSEPLLFNWYGYHDNGSMKSKSWQEWGHEIAPGEIINLEVETQTWGDGRYTVQTILELMVVLKWPVCSDIIDILNQPMIYEENKQYIVQPSDPCNPYPFIE